MIIKKSIEIPDINISQVEMINISYYSDSKRCLLSLIAAHDRCITIQNAAWLKLLYSLRTGMHGLKIRQKTQLKDE